MKRILGTLCSIFLFTLPLSATIPAGYYHYADSSRTEVLFNSLTSIISKAHMLRYGSGAGSTWAGFYHTDRDSNNVVRDMYSSEIRYQTDSNSVSGMHIEHSFPKSWWGAYMNNAYKDLFHLYPADGVANSTKNNLPLGEVCDATFDNGVTKVGPNCYGDYTGRSFEPADEYKGDFARSYFYVVTAHQSLSHLWNSPMLVNETYHCFTPWALDLLLKWHRQDPVSEKELARQEEVYKIQGNRNPYIDYPDLIEHLWGNDTNTVFTFPVETQPYLLQPDNWVSVNFGVKLQGSTIAAYTLPFEGFLLTDTLHLSLRQTNSPFVLSTNALVPNAGHNLTTSLNIGVQANGCGLFLDTLVVTSSELAKPVLIPIQLNLVNEFMALDPTVEGSTSATLNWMSTEGYPTSLVRLFEGKGTKAGDLFFSAYVEGSSWNKAIEIYNGTGKTIDLSNYSIRKQNNGDGAFVGEFQLSGLLQTNSSYVLVHGSASNTLLAIADSIHGTDQSSLLAFNGNDALALYHNQILIDVVGVVDDPSNWGENITLSRVATTTHPSSTFNWSDWQTYPSDTFSPLGQHTLVGSAPTSTQTYNITNSNSLLVTGLKPNTTYYYDVIGIGTAVNDSSYSVNSIQFTTQALEIPLALDASDIYRSQFTANWEDVPEYDHYLVDVFQIDNSSFGSWNVNFDSIGSNGKPLPEGWTGTASGSYTSTASSGKSPSSLAFKNNGEELISDTCDAPIYSLSFMYRYPSTATNSWFSLQGYNGYEWMNIDSIPYSNSTKTTMTYEFEMSDSIRAFRWEYHKSSGNLAIDDIEIGFGNIDTNFIYQAQLCNTNYMIVDSLEPMTTYLYRLCAVLGNVKSDYSATITTTTNEEEVVVGVEDIRTNNLCAYNTPSGMRIMNLAENTIAYVYTLNGQSISVQNLTPEHNEVSLPTDGFFLIRLVGNSESTTFKAIRFGNMKF